MKKWIVILTTLFALFGMTALVNTVGLATTDSIVLKKGIIVENRMLVPMRDIFEELGATVFWNDQERTVRIEKEEIDIVLQIDSSEVRVNEKQVTIDVPARIYQGRTYIPVRFMGESLGAKVEWDNERHIVKVHYDDTTIHIDSLNSLPVTPKKVFSVRGLEIGDSERKVYSLLGDPVSTYMSEYGFKWSIYHNDYRNYTQVGLMEGKVVALYTNDDLIRSKYALSFNSDRSTVRQTLGAPLSAINKGTTRYIYDSKGEHDLYLLDDYYATIFYDLHQSNQVTAIHLIEKNVEHLKKGFYGSASEELSTSFEWQLFNLTNATRVKYGKQPLAWNDPVSKTAQQHSEDMATHNYFSHENLQGQSPFDRIKKDNITYEIAGENMAMGQYSAIYALEGLMNSTGHRRNILNDRFTEIGIGVAFRVNIPYYTQNFITP